MIDLKINAPDINDIKARLGELSNRSHVVLYRAVNRTLDSTKTDITKQVSARYIVKTKTIRDSLKTKKANSSTPVGIITSKGITIPLVNFDATPKKLRKRFKNGKYNPPVYKARVLKKSPLIGVERMFYAKGQLMQRPENSSRNENKNIRNWLRLALSVPQMIGNKNIYSEIQQHSLEMLKKRVNHEIEYEMRRLKK